MFSGKPVASGLTHALIDSELGESQATKVAGLTEFATGFVGAGSTLNSVRLARGDLARINSAKNMQRSSGYGVDKYGTRTLREGDIIYGGVPGQSAWYTNSQTLNFAGMSRQSVWENLQVPANPQHGYRGAVGAYRVTSDIRVPAGTVNANPSYGQGGGFQYVIENFADVLIPAGRAPLGN